MARKDLSAYHAVQAKQWQNHRIWIWAHTRQTVVAENEEGNGGSCFVAGADREERIALEAWAVDVPHCSPTGSLRKPEEMNSTSTDNWDEGKIAEGRAGQARIWSMSHYWGQVGTRSDPSMNLVDRKLRNSPRRNPIP